MKNKTVYFIFIMLIAVVTAVIYITWVAYFSFFLPNDYYRLFIKVLIFAFSFFYLVRNVIKVNGFIQRIKVIFTTIICIGICVCIIWLPLNIGLPYAFHNFRNSPFCIVTTLKQKGISLYTKMGMKYYWRLGDGFDFKKIGVSKDVFDIANEGDSIKISGDKNFLGYNIHTITRE